MEFIHQLFQEQQDGLAYYQEQQDGSALFLPDMPDYLPFGNIPKFKPNPTTALHPFEEYFLNTEVTDSFLSTVMITSINEIYRGTEMKGYSQNGMSVEKYIF